jgi:hypothetical protein
MAAAAVKKRKGMWAILHNGSYGHAIGGARKCHNFYYVTWLGVVFGVSVGNSSLLF